jgi:hypothetical protein
MEEKKNGYLVRRLRIYLGLFYLVLMYGTYCMYMHEFQIMRYMKQPIRRWFWDVWFGIGPLPKLYMVISLYITLHLAVVGVVALIKHLRKV